MIPAAGLLSPAQEVRKGRLDPTILWDAIQVSPAAPSLVHEIENQLRENVWLVNQRSPIHLANVLNAWYFKDGVTEISALKGWQGTCHHLYSRVCTTVVCSRMPCNPAWRRRTSSATPAANRTTNTWASPLAEPPAPLIDDAALLIECDTASAYEEPAPVIIETEKQFFRPGKKLSDTSRAIRRHQMQA